MVLPNPRPITHYTTEKKCIFAVWARENERLKVEIEEKDDNFWKHKMGEKLKTFYMDCLLPELVDPRHTRYLQIRDPDYIPKSIEKKYLINSKNIIFFKCVIFNFVT